MKTALTVCVLLFIISEVTCGEGDTDPKCKQICPTDREPFDAKDSGGNIKKFGNDCEKRVWNECHGTDFQKTCSLSCDNTDNDPFTATDSKGNTHVFDNCCLMMVNNLCYGTDYKSEKCTNMLEGQINDF